MILTAGEDIRIAVSVIDGRVFVGLTRGKSSRKRISAYPLTPNEARNLGNILDKAAYKAEVGRDD